MGANQSTEATAHEKAAFERLRALQLEKKGPLEEEGYVYVNYEKASQGDVQPTLLLDSREPEGVAVGRMAEWQGELLKDPKNR
jgi:hypothetical protein